MKRLFKPDYEHFILENYLFTDGQSILSNKDSFPDKELLIQHVKLELIFFLEEEFAITVEAEEMIPENLYSVMNVIKFVEPKV